MIRIVTEANENKDFTSIVNAAKNRLRACVNKTKSGEGTKLLDSIDITLDALGTSFSNKETAVDFAAAMDSFGVNLQLAAQWADKKWGVLDTKDAPIPRAAFNSWIYKGQGVRYIASQLKDFWTKNKTLREAIRNKTPGCYDIYLPDDELLKTFFIKGYRNNKSNYGKYEYAIAFICSMFDGESGEPRANGIAYLTSNKLDVMWGEETGCEVKNNNDSDQGFNLSGTAANHNLRDCTYFKRGCLAIIDENYLGNGDSPGKVCICSNVNHLEAYIESTKNGGTGSREGMWKLKDNWMTIDPNVSNTSTSSPEKRSIKNRRMNFDREEVDPEAGDKEDVEQAPQGKPRGKNRNMPKNKIPPAEESYEVLE